MFVYSLIERVLALLCQSYHVDRLTAVERNLCALMSQKWYKIVICFPLRLRKACSKGVTRYETWGTGSRSSGENLEKTARIQVKKLKLYVIFRHQKKTPRARAKPRSFGKGGAVSSLERSLNKESQSELHKVTSLSSASVFLRIIVESVKRQNEFLTVSFYECSRHAADIAESHRPRTVWRSGVLSGSWRLL
ncbi:hypothetical protein V202x_11350 [Gimesia aquarii]|uniref:Uncharacterized protein n=1 Tax=Gimesia aquarii TaxID=2527964 RepID=A0A517WR93_9PLAN|nr:hypothetical protein V202x_11350 [Gimesia aquarii]